MNTSFKNAIAFLERQRYTVAMVINKIKRKINSMQLPTKKPQISTNRQAKKSVPIQKRHDIIGIMLVILVTSMAYSIIAVWFNISTDGIVPKIILVPQIVVVLGVIIWKFTKK